MKKILLGSLCLLAAFGSNAQDLVLRNSSCTPVNYTIIPTIQGTCSPDFSVSATIGFPAGVTTPANFDIQPGGPNIPIPWSGPVALSGVMIYSVTVTDASMTTSATIGIPCSGLPNVTSYTGCYRGGSIFGNGWSGGMAIVDCN